MTRQAKLGVNDFMTDAKRLATAIASVTGAAGPHNILSATHSDAATVAVSRGALIYGDNTPEWELLPVGVAGQLLHTDGVDVAWYTLLATDLPAHNLLSAQHGDTLTAAVSRGSLVYGNSTPAWAELVYPGGAGYALTTTATDVAWDQTPTWTGLHTFDGGWLMGAGQTGDLNGVADALVMDADGDTTLSAPTDDRIDIEISGADDFTFTANSFNVLSGSYITMADDTWIGLGAAAGRLIFDSTPAPDQIQLATADLYFNTGLGIIHADGVAAGMVLRANGTRYIPAAASTTIPFAPTARGDMIAADATPAWARLAFVGAANRLLTTTATDPAWSGYSVIGTAGQTYTFGTTGGTIPTAAGTLTVATANAITAAGVITHAITSSSNPGATASILASDASGYLQLTGLGIGVAAGAANRITIVNGGTIGQAAGPLLTFDDTNNTLELTGGDLTLYSGADLIVYSDAGATEVGRWDGATGAVSLSEYIYHLGDTDTYFRFQADQITARAGGTDMINIVEAATDYVNFPAGLVFINETSNAFQTIGMTINQGANTNEILTFKSSVTQGFTTYTEADTLGYIKRGDETLGGLRMDGYTNSTVGLVLVGLGSVASTAKSTAASAYVKIAGYERNGTVVGNATANANIVAFLTYRNDDYETIALIDEDGDFYYDGALVNYDDENDALAAWDLSHVLSGQWEQIMAYGKDRLANMGVISVGDDGRIMVSNKRLGALLMGAVGQLYQKCMRYEKALQTNGLLKELI